MKKVLVSLCMASAALGLSSCGSTQEATTTSSIDGEWYIVTIDGKKVASTSEEERPHIGFDTKSGRIHGFSGCNRLMGSFDSHATSGTIDLSRIGSTRMMCPDMTTEQEVLKALPQVKKYKAMKKDKMALCNSSGKTFIVLQKKEAGVKLSDLDGKWMIVEADGKAIPKKMETQPYFEFDIAQKKMHGNAGCNIINGAIVTDKNDPASISFPNVISTMMMCPDSDVESRVMKAMNAVKSFGKLPKGIGMYDDEHNLVLVLKKK